MLILDSTKRLSGCQDYVAWIHFQEKRFTAIFKPTVCKPGLGMQWSKERMYHDFDFYGNPLFFMLCFVCLSCTIPPLPALLGKDLLYFKLLFLLVLRLLCVQACVSVCVHAHMYVYKYTYGRTETRKSQKVSSLWDTRTLYFLPPFL